MTPGNENSGGHELASWKDIASYLGVNIRTAQRWENEKKLPIRRIAGAKGRLSANTTELDKWKEALQEQIPWWANLQLLQWYGVVVTILLAVTTAGLIVLHLSPRHGPPSSFRLDYNRLTVLDDAGRQVWARVFSAPFCSDEYSPSQMMTNPRIWFGDLDGDSKTETLFVYFPVTRETTGTMLICYGQSGRERWRFIPGRVVSDRQRSYSSAYTVANFRVVRLAGQRESRIVVTSHHVSYHPNQVAVLSDVGKLLGEYWHSGQLEYLEMAPVGPGGKQQILLAGVDNGRRSAVLVVLDPDRVEGASRQEPDDPTQLLGFGPGKETLVLGFPRSEINQVLGDYPRVSMLVVAPGRVTVHIQALDNFPQVKTIYTLSDKLELTYVQFSDRYVAMHNELEARRILNHRFSPDEIVPMHKIRVIQSFHSR